MSTTTVKTCSTTSCAFHQNGCTAPSITVSGDQTATCGTFVKLDLRRSAGSAKASVGTCKHLECMHNRDLLCTAESIEVRDDATCATYATK